VKWKVAAGPGGRRVLRYDVDVRTPNSLRRAIRQAGRSGRPGDPAGRKLQGGEGKGDQGHGQGGDRVRAVCEAEQETGREDEHQRHPGDGVPATGSGLAERGGPGSLGARVTRMAYPRGPRLRKPLNGAIE